MLVLFLIGYLATDKGFISQQTALLIFVIATGIGLLAVLQMVVASKGLNRRTLLITLGLTVGYLLIRTLNKYFG